MIEADKQEQKHDKHSTHLIQFSPKCKGFQVEGNALSSCSPATATHQRGTVCVWQRPISILPTSTVKASPEGGRRQKLNFLREMTWGRRRLVYHLSLEGFSELIISENLPHG